MTISPTHIAAFSTHHKVATSLMHQIGEKLEGVLGLPFQLCSVVDVMSGAAYDRLSQPCIALDRHSRIDWSRVELPVRTVHFIRDPREIVVSGYLYHKVCSEEWCTTPEPRYGGRTYQTLLRTASLDDGLSLEIETVSKVTLHDMITWRPTSEFSLEVRFEDVIADYNGTVAGMFRFLFDEDAPFLDDCMEAVAPFDISGQSLEERTKNRHITNHELCPFRWQKYLNESHLRTLYESFGNFMAEKNYIRL